MRAARPRSSAGRLSRPNRDAASIFKYCLRRDEQASARQGAACRYPEGTNAEQPGESFSHGRSINGAARVPYSVPTPTSLRRILDLLLELPLHGGQPG